MRLFASVFRLQTSDVRAQLLGHLGTAAAKAAEKAAKEAKSSGGMPSMAGLPGGVGGFLGAATGSGGSSAKESNLSSALANVSAALLGSLTTLRNKPSKSPLSASLEGPIDSVIVPCLSDADPAVRRAAAQCVHLTAELLGASYAARFVATAQTKLGDAKARADAKAGFALALGWLGRANAAAADDPANAPPGGGCGVPLKQLVAALGDAAGDANGGLASSGRRTASPRSRTPRALATCRRPSSARRRWASWGSRRRYCSPSPLRRTTPCRRLLGSRR